MKLSKKILFLGLGVGALAMAGASSFVIAKSHKSNVEPAQVSATEGYTTYFSNELGFATRNADDDRIVLGDSDGGQQSKGNVLNAKCELRFTHKQTRGNYWFGVGGYAVYSSDSTQDTIRFLVLTRNENGTYGRNAVKSGMTMKTEDGSTELSTVIASGKYFSDYVDTTVRFDLTDLNAPKIEFFVEYNGVKYYPFDGSGKVGVYTYATKQNTFTGDDVYRAMVGANVTDSGKSMLKFKTNDVHLDNILQVPTATFSYSYIDNFFFTVNCSEKIYTNKGYFNDHLTDLTYANRDGQNINIGDGIIINGQTFNYWRNYTPANLSYPRNDGVMAFPLNAASVFNPVAIEVHTSSLEFKVNLEEIPMDGIVVTFKAGIFEGYYNGVTFKLENDVTFYSTVSTSGGPHRVSFSKTPSWDTTSLGVRHLDDNGEHTASKGGKYHRWLMWTNIPFDPDHITQGCPADNYRYMYDNLLMNGKPITYYNAWVRGNSKDFTNLSDTSTQNPDYELSHPTGSANTVYDLGIRIEVVTDQPVYAFQFSVPNQLVTDLSLGTLTFGLRDGSSWLSKDEKGNLIVGRLDKTYFENKIIAAYEELENYVVLSDYDPEQQAEIAEIITNAQAEMENIVTEAGLNEVVANAKALIDNVKNAEEMIEQQHIDRVVELINAIPAEIAYTQECSDAINAAMEAYATLTASEIAKFPSESLDKLFNAYVALKALDLANYKTLSKAEINAMVDPNDYRDLEKDTVTTLVNNALAAIDDATTKEEVQQIVNELRALLSAVPTDAELTALELKVAKANAKAELDAIDLSVYRETERAYVEELINNGKIAIDQCLTIEEVEILLNKIKTVIAGVQTDSDLSEVQAALAVKQARERTIIIVSIISSLSLIIGAGLVIFLIRRRKVNQ